MILARLLSPAEIGIFSIAAVLVAIAHIFRDFGVGSYLLRERDLTPEKIQAASGVLFASSWSIAAFLFLVSPWVARFYSRPEVEDVVKVLALGFVFIPFGAITHTLLTREYRAKEQALASVAGVSFYALSSVLLAYMGFSYMTMAWANLINIVVTAIAYLPMRPAYAPWLPSLKGWRSVINFGTGAIVGNSVSAINNAIPDVVLGKLSGPYEVGVMSRSTSTTNIFTLVAGPTINYAVLPFLAKKHHSGEPLNEPIGKAISYLTICGWPALLVTAVFSHEVVVILYGVKWLDCVPIISVLCFTAALILPVTFNNQALMAIGRPYLAALPGGMGLVLKAVTISLLFDGSLMSFAYALLIASIVNFPVYLWLQHRYLSFSFGMFVQYQLKSIVISIILLLSAITLRQALDQASPLVQLVVVTMLLIPFWIFLICRIRHPILREFMSVGGQHPWLGRLLHTYSK